MEERKKPVHLTPAQKLEIINSPLKNIELVKLYNSNSKTISQIRIRAKKNPGKIGQIGGAYNCKLTPYQIKEIIETTTPSSELAAKFNVAYETVWAARKRHGVVLPKKPKKDPVFLNDQQREEVANSNLSTEKLAEIYNIEKNTVLKIKRKAGKGIGTGNSYVGKLNTNLTESQKKEIIESDEYLSVLAARFNVSVARISRVRKVAGVVCVRAKKQLKKKEIKSIKQPVKKRTINQKKTSFEEENERRIKAEKAAESYRLTEKQKLDSGLYAWKQGPCRSMVLAKIN